MRQTEPNNILVMTADEHKEIMWYPLYIGGNHYIQEAAALRMAARYGCTELAKDLLDRLNNILEEITEIKTRKGNE